jgi:glycerol-3-phosphate dehydrogenase
MNLNRSQFLQQLEVVKQWDIVIIGGGATGLGCALDAASRGLKTLLLEQADFSKGTSSRSTKLIHGGVRYLAQGNIKLVFEALHERGLLLNNAPHLIKKQQFIIPCYSWFARFKYLLGLKLYDWLAGNLSFGAPVLLSKRQVQNLMPGINSDKLKGGIVYFDGQFDDSRLAIDLAQTTADHGGILINYFQVKSLVKDSSGRLIGVKALELENNREYTIIAKKVINATGVFADQVLQMDVPDAKSLIRPSQGVHLVLNSSFFPGNYALMIPKTSDGRVLFAVPWHDRLLVGTTDTPVNTYELEPVALKEEIDFILTTAGQYLIKKPIHTDILSVFAGLRPLSASNKDNEKTKELSRSHKLVVSASGLITITGGKWTTYRKMAEDTIDQALQSGFSTQVRCITEDLPLANRILELYLQKNSGAVKEFENLTEKLDSRFTYNAADVIWSVRFEMARTVEDVLARRLRVLFLDAEAALRMAPRVVQLIAGELGYHETWEKQQLEEFRKVCQNYQYQSYI